MKEELDNLFQKEMDRKQFLKHVAVGFASITGVAAVVKTMNGFGSSSGSGVGQGVGSSQKAGLTATAYGGSIYGGKRVAQQVDAR